MHPSTNTSMSDDESIPATSSTMHTTISNELPTDAATKRKISHSAIEKRRRERINVKIMQLKSLVPQCHRQENVHKLDILQGAIDYILALQNQIQQLSHAMHIPQANKQQHPHHYNAMRPESPINDIALANNYSMEHGPMTGRVTPTSSTSPSPPTPQQYRMQEINYQEPHHHRTSPVKRGRPSRPSPMSPRPNSISAPIARHTSPLSHHYTNHSQPYSPFDSTASVKSESTDSSLPSPPSTHDSPPPIMARDKIEDPLRLLSDAAAKLSAGMSGIRSSSNACSQEGQQGDIMSVNSLLS